jgi:hypothetical protein
MNKILVGLDGSPNSFRGVGSPNSFRALLTPLAVCVKFNSKRYRSF